MPIMRESDQGPQEPITRLLKNLPETQNKTKPDLRGQATRGRIIKIERGLKHGYVWAADREVYFHRADLKDGVRFNDLEVGDRVSFELFDDKVSGPRALHLAKLQR
jgi:cold shock CspA family protein